jgi:hypothetical protein
MFKRSHEECAANSRTRRQHLAAWGGRFAGRFDWVQPPVLNPYTRLAVEMCPARGGLMAIGYERGYETDLPQAVTRTPASVDPGLPRSGKDVGIALTGSGIS